MVVIWLMYIWQNAKWPHFQWDDEALRPYLDAIRLLQGRLLGNTDISSSQANLAVEMDALIQNAIRTSEIEGEHLDVASVRSSVARQLGVEQIGLVGKTTSESDQLVALLRESTSDVDIPLSLEQLCRWQAMLFASGSSRLLDIAVGQLRGEQPMQVVSGRIDRPRVHFEAPPRHKLDAEMDGFIAWFNQPPAALDRSSMPFLPVPVAIRE